MRRILLSGFFLFLLTGLAQGQRIPLEVSFGVGGYFPEDGRYARFFDHNPASFSGQASYHWSVLDFKAGFEQMRKRTDSDEQFSDIILLPPYGIVDTIVVSHTAASLKSYMRASSFRLGAAFHPFREAAFSPFIGFGASFGSTKGYGDSLKVVTDTLYDFKNTATPQDPDTVVSVVSTSSQVPGFSESFSGFYLEAGAQARLPYRFFFVFEAVRDFRSKDKAGVIGPAKGGGTLLGIRLGYRF